MAYKIIFIDEENSQHELFQTYIEESDKQLEVKCLFPKSSLEEMLETIVEETPDAIVSDYLLNDIKEDIDYNIPYTGVELVKQFQQERPNFPCFIITSFDNEAVAETNDVNLVYIKALLTNGEVNTKARFYDKIYEQIAKYKNLLDNAQEEINILIEKRRLKTSTLDEDQRLIELDDFLEKSLHNSSRVPSDMKKTENIENLALVIEKLDELLGKLE